jgi:hypothetical protein
MDRGRCMTATGGTWARRRDGRSTHGSYPEHGSFSFSYRTRRPPGYSGARENSFMFSYVVEKRCCSIWNASSCPCASLRVVP